MTSLWQRLDTLDTRISNNKDEHHTSYDRATIEMVNKELNQQRVALQEIIAITKGLIDMNPAYEKIHNIALNGLEEQHD